MLKVDIANVSNHTLKVQLLCIDITFIVAIQTKFGKENNVKI